MNISSVPPSVRGRRWRLQAGLSPVALLVASLVCDSAVAQSLSNLMQQKLATPTQSGAATTSTATMQTVTRQSAQSLQRALGAIQSNPTASALVQLQNRQAAPSGYVSGCAIQGPLCGIQPDTSATATWTNVDLPTKDLNPAAPVATVVQTKSKGIATWKSLNLAPGETLDFKQPDSSSILLNRINDLNPTQIFGQIKANGQIYLINGNGIIFGGSAKVDVHALIASSLDIGSTARSAANGMSIAERNKFFLERGIAATQSGNLTTPSTGLLGDFSSCGHVSCAPLSGPFEGSVVVKSGAQINTTVTSSAGSPEEPGFVYLLAPYVRNDGTITSPKGEVLLAAGQNFTLTPKGNAQQFDPGQVNLQGGDATGFARAVGLLADNSVNNPTWLTIGPGNAAVDQNFRPSSTGATAVGTVVNSGLIETSLGTTFIAATTIDHSGIIEADTGVTRNGSIVLQAARTLTLSPSSALIVRPAHNGETTPISADGTSPFLAPTIRLSGEAVTLQGDGVDRGAIVYAPSAAVSISAQRDTVAYGSNPATPRQTPQQRVYLDNGSLIDVSGVEASLSMSANLVTFQPRGQEFADSPLQRQGALRGADITIDIRKSGTRADGFQWVGTPLADASGFVNLIPRNIDYLLSVGGKITISSIGDVVSQSGSRINYNGGLVRYDGGVISTTRLLGSDGRIRDISAADPLGSYLGIAGTQSFTSAKWGITNTYTNALLSGSVFEAGYVDGRSAGSLTVAPSSGAYLAGSISGAAIAGAKQAAGTVKGNGLPSAGSLTITTAVSSNSPTLGRGDICLYGGTSACGAGQSLPTAPASSVASLTTSDLFLSADALSNTGLGQVSLTANGTVTVGKEASLSVAAGGAITLIGFNADIEGTLRANAGSVTVRARGNEPQSTGRPTPTQTGIIVGSSSVIDASGLWINDTGLPAPSITGSKWINGGSISLTTDLRTGGGQVDITGSINLLAGSLIDVSSGGYVQTNGKVLLDAVGRPAGNGGNLRLVTGSGTYNTSGDAPPDQRPSTTALSANVAMNGSIRAFGFSQGGTLTLQVPTIQIGGTPLGDPGEFDIDPARFFGTGTTASPGMGFAKFALTAISGGIVVQPNTTISLQQVNFAPLDAPASLGTGASVATATGLVRQSDFQRSGGASGLSLTDAGLLDAPLPAHGYQGILINAGAKVVGDGGAAIKLSSATIGAGQTRRIDVFGQISAPGGSIDITGASAAGTSTIVRLGAQATLDASGKVLLDPQKAFATGKVLAGGTVNIALAARGSVLVGDPGTTIDVSGAAGTFDLSIPSTSAGLSFASLVSTPVWSDAGSISVSAQTVLYGGRYVGRAGAPEGNGGSLTLSGPTGGPGPGASTAFRGIVVVQSVDGNALAASFGGIDALVSQLQFSSLSFLNNSANLVVDSLNGSGIANLSLLANVVKAGTLGTTVSARGDLVLYGNALSLQVPGSLVVDAQRIVQLPDVAGVSPTASLTAGYVSLQNSVPVARSASSFVNTYPTVTGGTLRVSAKAIDIANLMLGIGSESRATANIAQAFFTSAGDIRLSVPTVNSDATQLQNLFSQVYSAGDITFRAAQLYPVSGVDATIKSQGTVRFEQNGPTPTVPLSAGGRLVVDASRIEQFGTIRAPLGQIVLGARSIDDLSPNDPDPVVTTVVNIFTGQTRTDRIATRFVDTQGVILGDGSLTSVSLEGATVPFGHTKDGGLWSFYTQRYQSSAFGSSQPAAALALSAAPSKRIGLNGGAVSLNSGAVVDISGGGDIQAIEFIAGTGGSRDVLAPTYASNGATLPQYPNGRAIYAILPGYKGSVAPTDFDFQATYGDSQPAAGSSVYLSGGSGLAAGVYTLLPAHYATLPGAYRVVVRSAGNDAVAGLNGTQADGSMLISGYGVNALTGGRDSRNSLYEVQSGDVWRLYSQVDSTSGNKRFGELNARAGTVAQVPADAGNLVVAAVRSLSIDSTLKSSGDLARGGRGGEVDVSAQNIQILGSGATALAGYLAIDSAALSAFAGAGASLVIGGVRDVDSSGKTSVLTPVASSVVITNSAADPLSAPEVILVAQPKTGDANSANGIVVASGSVVTAIDTLQAGQPGSLTIGRPAQGSTAGTSGSGAFLRVANGAPVTVIRQNVINGSAGQLTVGANAVLGGQSVTLDSTGSISVAPSVTLVGGSTARPDAVSLSAANIGFDVPVGSGLNIATVNGAGLRTAFFDGLLDTKQLRLAAGSGGAVAFGRPTDLTLAAAGTSIDIDAATIQSFGALSGGGAVNIGAARVTLTNSGSSASTAQTGAASLVVAGDEVVLGAGSKVVSGFGLVTMTAGQQMRFNGAGSLNALNADVTLASPLLLAASGAKQNVTTTGALVLADGGSRAALPADGPETPLGGQLTFSGRSVRQSTTIQAIAGAVTLAASTGDVTLVDGARIVARGFAHTIFDVETVANGGTVTLSSTSGNVAVNTGPTANGDLAIDVSAALSDGSQHQVASSRNAGQITLRAISGDVAISTPQVLAGVAHGGRGGSLTLDGRTIGGGAAGALDQFAAMTAVIPMVPETKNSPSKPAAGGFDDAFVVRTRQGDLTLSQGLKARSISLTADGGVVAIANATLDASATKGGSISLIGREGVIVSNGKLRADATDATQRGGSVVLETSCNSEDCSGIQLSKGTGIDVSGGIGGTVTLRAPLFVRGGGFDVAVSGGIDRPKNQPVVYLPVDAKIVGARTIDVVANRVIDAANFQAGSTSVDRLFNGIIDPAGTTGGGSPALFVNELTAYVQSVFPTYAIPNIARHFEGTSINGVSIANGGPSVTDGIALISGTDGKVAEFRVKPGIELDNSSSAVNGGDISLLSSWNLGALDDKGRFRYRVGGSQLGAAGELTLRATRDVNIGFNDGSTLRYASLTDGFAGASANAVSPTAAQIASATVFRPVQSAIGPILGADGLRYRAPDSWSYTLVAGADFAGADRTAVVPIEIAPNSLLPGFFAAPGSVNLAATSAGAAPTVVRTGTGSIRIAAARDVDLCVVAGLLCQQSTTIPRLAEFQPGAIYTAGVDTVDPAGFVRPTEPGCVFCIPAGPYSIAYPTGGGSLTVTAQGNVNSFQAVRTSNGTPYYQFWSQWLLASVDPTTNKSTWGINFGGFDQGLMSVGGDVSVVAGGDLNQLSISLPTTARSIATANGVSLRTTSSGDLTVAAGGDLLSGSYYVGSGVGQIRVAGGAKAGWTSGDAGPADPVNATNQSNSGRTGFVATASNYVPTVLAVDNGTIDLAATQSVSLAGVVSPVSLQNLFPTAGNAGAGGTIFVSSYGPSSAVRVQSVAGDIATNGYVDPVTGAVFAYNPLPLYAYGSRTGSLPRNLEPFGVGANAYPATFQASALRGDLTVAGSLQLAPSTKGQLDLVADGSLTTTSPLNGSSSDGTRFLSKIGAEAVLSTGPTLMGNGFDPYMPQWNAVATADPDTFVYPTSNATVLLHQDDPLANHFYARTGDITDGRGTSSRAVNAMLWEITKQSDVRAGRDIVDLNFFGQNLSDSDVTSVTAGRDLFYTGKNNAQPFKTSFNTSGSQSISTLRIAGPGYFDVEAGRDFGPFLLASTLGDGQGIVTIGNESEFSSGYGSGTGGIIGNRIIASENGNGTPTRINPTLDGFAPSANPLLPRKSASISISFGVSPGGVNAVEYQAFINAYIDPAKTPERDYGADLLAFLRRLGVSATSTSDAFAKFKTLSTALQEQFARQVFFEELKLVGDPNGCCFNQSEVGLKAIATLFPAGNGFASTGTSATGPVSGDLNLLHSTVQTRLGGDITILGPAGSIILGSIEQPTVTTRNGNQVTTTAVPLQNEGLLTIAGGAIRSFTDGSVLVNQSRIFTQQGGDIVLWSTNGDLDAGRGAKTSASFPPLEVQFPRDNLPVVNLAGLVTGAGIGALQSTPDAPASDVYVIALRGIVNFGDAGVRSSRNLNVAAETVVNGDNGKAAGSTSGVTITKTADVGSTEAASSAAASSSKASQDSESTRQPRATAQSSPSLITVEVLGYGGVRDDDPRLREFDCSVRKGPGC